MNVFLHPKAAKALGKLDKSTREEIKDSLAKLEKDQKQGKPLKYCNFRSLRIGDYRAIYEINKQNNKIVVLFIDHRKRVYDEFSRLI